MFSILYLISCCILIINLEPIMTKQNTLSDSKKYNINNTINDFNMNVTFEQCLEKDIFLPEYQNKYSRINELNDTNFNFIKIKSNRSVTLVPDNLIDGNEKQLEIDNIADMINKIEKNNNKTEKSYKNKNEVYGDDYSFYSQANIFFNDFQNINYKYIKDNSLIYEKSSSSIKDIITTNPDKLKIEYDICKPKSMLFKIINPNLEDNLIIKGIKTDLYQVKIFPFISNKSIEKNNLQNITPSINSYLDYTIYPQSSFIFQLLFLLDHKTTIKGTLYIEFNEKKVLLIPIQLTGKENYHRFTPVYYLNHQIKKLFYVPIQIFNPTTKTLIIKEIIHSFEKIKVYWPNDEIFNNNISSVSSSMLQVEPMCYKKLFYLKFYTTKIESEYGFIHIRTEKNVNIVPVLVNMVNTPILSYPKFFNFGLCDVTPKSRNNFIRMIPLKLLNDGIEYIKIGKVYIDYDELFLQFHQNFGGENIVIKPNEEVLFGYVIFNSNLEKNLEKKLIKRTNFFGQLTKKLIYIETNSTNSPLVEIEYSYMPFINNELQEIIGNIQTIPKNSNSFSFITKVKIKKPIKIRVYNSYLPGENITIYNDKFVTAKMANPLNENQVYNSKIMIEIDKLTKFKTLHNYYLPLRLNNLLYTIIPIQIDNDDLTKIYCGNEENSRTLSICMKNLKIENKISTIKGTLNKKKIFHIDFGNVALGVKKQKFIYLINENELPIPINNIITDYNNLNFLVDIESYEYFGNGDEPSNIKYPKKGDLYEKLKNTENNESISFKIYPHTAVKFSINLLTNEDININTLKSSITFYYGDEYKFILSLNATLFKGNINLSPVIYKFEPSFPGLYQKKIIYTKSSFNFPLNIVSISSSDERIIPQLLTDKIYPKNKTALIQVNFDPSKTYFIKEDLNQFELNMSNILTYRELYLWKAKEKFFNKLGSTGRTEINANVTITTSIDKGDINFKSFLIKPNLSKKEELNFGLIQIGKPVNTYIEGINPSDKMLLIKLILASDNFGDVNNNSMFNEKDRNLLEKNNDLIIFGCNFLIMTNDTLLSKYEYIVVPEKIDPIELRKGTFDKKNLITILYKYGSDKVKNYLYNAKNILCRYDKKIQNEIIFNKNKNNYLISHIYSNEFNNEIPSVKNMTKKNIDEDNQYKFVEKKSFFNSILTYLFNFYLKYFMNMSLYSNINIIEHTQSFFIPSDIQEKIFQVPPHKKFTIGPIIFKPNKTGLIKGTLFLKNNLTILYPLKLIGNGGGGVIKFVDYYRGISKKKSKLYNEKSFVIEIDENIYEKEIKGVDKFNRTITLMNYGNLPMTINNMSIDNSNECQINNMRIIQCKEFTLNPQEMINIDIEITPNFRNAVSNKIIYFNTEYQSFYLNVIIVLSNDLYEMKNYLWIYFKCFIIVFTIVSIMLYSLSKIINLIQKQRREMCDNDSAKEDIEDIKEEKKESLLKSENEILLGKIKNNNINENEQLEYNYNYHTGKNKKKEKKKKNRKKSNSSINQKDEIETNHNNEKKKEQNNNNNNNTTYNNNNKIEEKIENINNKNNKIIKEEKKDENKNKINNIKEESNKKQTNNAEINIKNNNNGNDKKKDNKIPTIDIPKPKKKNINKGSYKISLKDETKENDNKSDKYEKEVLSDRTEIKRDKNNENISEDKKNKKYKEKKKISSEQRIKSNENKKIQNKNNEVDFENEVIENNNYNYNYHSNKNSYQYRNNRKPGKNINNKKYNSNRKYITYDSSQNNNGYNNNYQQPQPKKQITKIKKGNNAKNLKELFEIEHSKGTKVKEVDSNIDKNIKKNESKQENTNNVSINNNIIDNNNISNIKISNEEIEDDFGEELFDNKRQSQLFNYQLPIDKKMNNKGGEKNEEMNPTFLNDIKTSNAFDAEQELIKSLKKENKDMNNKSNNGELSKEDIDMDLSSSHLNFDYYFFDKEQQPQENEEPEYKGNYEDYRFKSFIDNLNNVENTFTNEDQKANFDLLLNNNINISNSNNKEESEDKKEEIENEDSFKANDYEQYTLNKIKFDNKFNYFGFEINNDNLNNDDKKFQNKFDEYQKSFGKNWKK